MSKALTCKLLTVRKIVRGCVKINIMEAKEMYSSLPYVDKKVRKSLKILEKSILGNLKP